MCHVSVGHVQRVLEASGLPTVSVYVAAFAHVPRQMAVSRAVITPHPMGRPLGAPGDAERQLDITRFALHRLTTDEPATVEYPHPYRTWPTR